MKNTKVDSNSHTRYNLGLCLLKIMMSFGVVLDHFGHLYGESTPHYLEPFYVMGGLAVPCFMLMSFLLNEKAVLQKDKKIMKRRIYRLGMPHVVWAIIYWGVSALGSVLHMNNSVSISDLLWQLLLGHSRYLNPSMWFQTVLIFLSLLFFLAFYFFPEQIGIVMVSVLGIGALIFQYSGVNFCVFSKFEYELGYPLGRICEMIPYASTGFLIAYYNIFEKMKKREIIIGSIILIFLLKITNAYGAAGFGYSGIHKIVFSAFIVMIFFSLPVERMNIKIKAGILFISQFTFGIYCMHFIVGRIVVTILDKLNLAIGSFKISVIIFLTCMTGSYVISRLPCPFFEKLVK